MPKTPKFTRQQIYDLAVGCEHRTALRNKSQPAWLCATTYYPELLDELFGPVKKRMQWTKETIIASMEGYTYLAEWRKDFGGAYKAARRICPDEMYRRLKCKINKRGYSTDEILNCARRCNGLHDMEKKFSAQYQYANRHYKGLIQKEFGFKHQSWDFDEMIALAKKYEFKIDLLKANRYVYNTLYELHLLDDFYVNQNEAPWTAVRLTEEARNYETLGELRHFKPSAYNAAQKLGLTAKHLGLEQGGSKNDRFYIWLSSDGWYKFGHTTRSLHTTRMEVVSRAAKVEIVKLYAWDAERATDIENYVKKFGNCLTVETQFDGSTECRWFTPTELETILNKVDDWAKRVTIEGEAHVVKKQ